MVLLSMKFPSMKYLSANEMSHELTLNTVIYLSSAGARIDRYKIQFLTDI